MQRFMTGAAAGAPDTRARTRRRGARARRARPDAARSGRTSRTTSRLLSGAPAREITEAGLRAKVTPPLLALPWRTWAFLGVGYARAYEPSHHLEGSGDFVPGQAGGFLESRVGARRWATGSIGPGSSSPSSAGGSGCCFAGSAYDRGGCGCGAALPGKRLLRVVAEPGAKLGPVAYGPLRAHARPRRNELLLRPHRFRDDGGRGSGCWPAGRPSGRACVREVRSRSSARPSAGATSSSGSSARAGWARSTRPSTPTCASASR